MDVVLSVRMEKHCFYCHRPGHTKSGCQRLQHQKIKSCSVCKGLEQLVRDCPKIGSPNVGEKRTRTESHVSPTTIAQSLLASQPDDSNGSKTEEIYLTTSASKYATIDPVATNSGGSTSTNPSPEQTVDNYSDIEIDDINDSDYMPPEESEGSSDDIQDEEEVGKMLIDSQEVEDLQKEENNQMDFAQYPREDAVVIQLETGPITLWSYFLQFFPVTPPTMILYRRTNFGNHSYAQFKLFEPLTIYVIHAPATSETRLNFLCDSNRLLQFHQASEDRCILMGEFNHNIYKSLQSDCAVDWQHWIHRFWYDPIYFDQEYRNMSTFRNISTIDFLLVTNDLKYDVSRPAVQYVPHCYHSAIYQFTFWKTTVWSMYMAVQSLPCAKLDQIAEFSANTLALRSGLHWRKHVERSNSYFYKTIRTRTQKQTIHKLLSSEGYLVRSPNQLNDCTKQFYEQLYSPNLIEYEALEELLIQISTSTCFDTATTPSYSSPGVDGIPYELLQILLQHPFYIRLFTKVLNNALQHTDNGVITRLVMDVAQRMKPPGIALLLDQEKAYDRVHPHYLQACIDKFGFPQSLVASIISLFGTTLCINVNGFLTVPISEARGLRQGNPLYPLLFNLAIEPLLRFIWSSPLISGFTFLRPQQPNFTSLPRPSPPLKVLTYAGNVLVFLTRPTELQTLLYLVFLYGKASNARSNRGKTLAVSLSAEDHQDWRQMLSANGITQWHNKRAYLATAYLGYSLTSSVQQMPSYLDSLIKNFPFVKFQDYQQSRNEGGIAILDPSTQHSALQLRWFTPPLLSSDQATNPDFFATSLMKYTLCVLSFAPSPVLPLLFPDRRITDLHKIGCFNSLFKTIDQMDFETNWTALNSSSAAEIPLS
ncbi:hypothetical protein G6F37_010178 [Rhizopus arrhizus]|nr:hypothetical protein G6F38_010254 [Rhizopus arrhizus]KAG1153635.1 hypothetical protein G6F37_010178 [Rhizopus arrhizus]